MSENREFKINSFISTLFLKDVFLTFLRVTFFQFLGLNFLTAYPLVLLFLRKRWSWILGLAITFALAFIGCFMVDFGASQWMWFTSIIFAFLPSVILVFSMGRYRQFAKAMLISVWIYFIALYLGILGSVAKSGSSHDEYLEAWLTSFTQSLQGQTSGNNSLFDSLISNAKFLVWVAPGLIFVFSAILMWINLLMLYSDDRVSSIRQHLAQTGVSPPKTPISYTLLFFLNSEKKESNKHFKELTLSKVIFPDTLIWLILTVLAVNAAGLVFSVESVSRIGLNALIMASTAYFFLGLSIASHFISRWNIGSLFRFLIYFVLFLHYIFVVLIGVFDHWFDFRKLRNIPKSKP